MGDGDETPSRPQDPSQPTTEKAAEFSHSDKGINVAPVVSLPVGYEPPSAALLGVPIVMDTALPAAPPTTPESTGE